jgi:hypothetical protein
VQGTPLQRGTALGSAYVLAEPLGSGAMGQVWSAVDSRTGEQVAAKLLREELVRDPEIVARFVQERTVLLGLQHPHVVRVRDLVVEGDALAIVMDLVEGSDLRRRLRAEGTLAPAEAAATAAAVLEALAAAHALGVLHRDVKPDNVLLGRSGEVLLSDFSIARLAQETTVRMTGVLGTAEYIAPEVFESEQTSAAADVYGAGVLLYELLAGRTPFAGAGTGYAIARRHVQALPPALPGLPAPLVAAVLRLLEKDPSRRPTAAAAAAELRGLVPSLVGVAALPVQPAPTSWEELGREVGDLRVAGDAGGAVTDLGRTTVRASGGPEAPVPVDAGPARWSGSEAAAGGHTQVRAQPRPEGPRLDDAVAPAAVVPPARERRRWPLVAAGVVAVAAVVGGVALLGGGRDDGDGTDRPAQPVASEVISVTLPPAVSASGLTTTREASFDPASGEVMTTVTWTAGATALSGPFYEVVPPTAAGQDCPAAVWDTTALRDATEGLPLDACGWRVAVAGVASGSSASASYALPGGVDRGKEVGQQLRERLVAAEQATAAALSGLAVSSAYPAQRLTGLVVQVGGTISVGSPIELAVLPTWLGVDEPDAVNALLAGRTTATTNLLRQLGGALSLSSDDCSGALAFSGNRPYANTVARDCTITARLGALAGTSRSFDITQRSTGTS